jgi:hypothetical protein
MIPLPTRTRFLPHTHTHNRQQPAKPKHTSTHARTWLIQYELSTRRPPSLRPAFSSALDLRLRTHLSWLIPWFLGFPYTMPLGLGRLRPPRRTATRYTTKPWVIGFKGMGGFRFSRIAGAGGECGYIYIYVCVCVCVVSMR